VFLQTGAGSEFVRPARAGLTEGRADGRHASRGGCPTARRPLAVVIAASVVVAAFAVAAVVAG
jgi:hypothetical protein